MLNQCRIFYFTIIIRENSLHVTGCIGFEEIPKNVPKIYHEIFPNRGGDISHVMVFFMLNQCRILCFTIFIRENSLHVTSFGVEEIPKKRPKHLA